MTRRKKKAPYRVRKKKTKKIESDSPWSDSDEESNDEEVIVFDEEDIPKKPKKIKKKTQKKQEKKTKRTRKKKKKPKKKKKTVVNDDEDEDEEEIVPIQVPKKRKRKRKKKLPKNKKKTVVDDDEDEDEDESVSIKVPKKKKRKRKRKVKKKIILEDDVSDNGDILKEINKNEKKKVKKRKRKKKKKIVQPKKSKLISLNETPDITQFIQKKKKRVKTPPISEDGSQRSPIQKIRSSPTLKNPIPRKRKRERENDEFEELLEEEKVKTVQKKKRRVERKIPSNSNFLLVSNVGLADLDEIDKFLPKKDILKLKIYNGREKYFLITDAIHQNKFGKRFNRRMKIVDPRDFRNRQIQVQHILVNLPVDVVEKYFSEIGEMKISGTKIRNSCRNCRHNPCKKVLITFNEFESVLDSMDFSGAAIRGRVINVKPTFLYDAFRF